jgi:hypothetical protein
MSESDDSEIEYNEYYDDQENENDHFHKMFTEINNHINMYGNIESYMKKWLYRQFHNCKDKLKLNELLSNKFIKELYEKRITKKTWQENYHELKTYVNKYDKIPNQIADKDLRKWLQNQKSLYKNKKLNIYKFKKLTELKHVEEFMKNVGREKWDEMLDKIKDFINENGYLPSHSVHSNANEKILARWITTQIQVLRGNREWKMSEIHEKKLMEIELIKHRVNCK